jgi:hypothetical protein
VNNRHSGRVLDRRADRRKGFPKNSYFAGVDDGFEGKAEIAQMRIDEELQMAFSGKDFLRNITHRGALFDIGPREALASQPIRAAKRSPGAPPASRLSILEAFGTAKLRLDGRLRLRRRADARFARILRSAASDFPDVQYGVFRGSVFVVNELARAGADYCGRHD